MIVLPWFSKELNPNHRSHWSVKSRLRRLQKKDAYYVALSEPVPEESEQYPLCIKFYPPDNRGRDIDNCIAAIKGALDGIAFAWKVNDKQFQPITASMEEACEHGKITIEY